MLANEIVLDRIEVPAGRRVVDPDAVKHLVESIAAVGLQHPISVRKRDGAYVLVAGRHRLAAFRELKMERIPANVVDLSTLESEILEIDENLCRNDLSVAERSAATARRKIIYQELHPETKHGAIGGGHKANGSEKADKFTKVTAEATGRSERAIQRDAERGKTLGHETLAKVAHTSLDKGAELDALAKLSVDDRDALVDRAAAGETVSAQVVPDRRHDGGGGRHQSTLETNEKTAIVPDDEQDPHEAEFITRADTAIAAARYSGDVLYESLIDKSREVVRAWQSCLIALEREWQALDE